MPKLRPYFNVGSPYIIVTVRGGKVQGAYLNGIPGQVFVADLDELEGLAVEERAPKILHGVKQRRMSGLVFDDFFHAIVTDPSTVEVPEPTPLEALNSSPEAVAGQAALSAAAPALAADLDGDGFSVPPVVPQPPDPFDPIVPPLDPPTGPLDPGDPAVTTEDDSRRILVDSIAGQSAGQ